ncbi:hypothetical protein SELMODRAFT_232550 [Selaginella moellendorffii]|uniref:GHMP kinase N-terminal domain-containing protein n=1 Tax=Selaginella moellendorffii TaxID=88036 RepID=D8RWV8_SELML|nr:hypothetical protein SELMODRAFT_232550 [Selaginella moellendorffii]
MGAVEHRAYARIGLLGNPSDGYYGRTIALAISNFWATVSLQPSDLLALVPHSHHDLCRFSSIQDLVGRVQSEGYYGGVRLLTAACKTFHSYCSSHGIDLHDGNFTLSYDTNIPRQAGLSGSSALVCATMNCLMDFYNVRDRIPVEDRPKIVLNRVAQVYGGLVYMDFDEEHMLRTGNGIYKRMDPQLLPPLYVIYAQNPSDSGKVHSTVKQRWLDGDLTVRTKMREVAELALRGKQALLEGNHSLLAELMDRNFDLRREMFGDDALGALNIQMVETARSVGAACKFTGSGGAVVAFCPEGSVQAQKLQEACSASGLSIELVQVAAR